MKINIIITLVLLLGTISQSIAGDGVLIKREVKLNSGSSLNLSYLNKALEDSVSRSMLAKRPGLSFMSSVVLPGAGQYYNGSMKKAAGFLAAEIVLWWGYTKLQGNANDKVDEYKDFAEEYWSYDDWIASGDIEGGHKIDENPNTGGPVRNNEYYENIGKYNQFNRGWLGSVSSDEDDLTPERAEYILMQQDANNSFSLARTLASTVMLNHILSAAEAVYTAKKLNDEAALTFSLKAIPVKTQEKISAWLSLSVAW